VNCYGHEKNRTRIFTLMNDYRSVLFFDGVCKFCNHSVNRLIRLDKSGRIAFSALQGELAKTVLPESDLSQLDSLVYVRRGVIYRHSSAVIFALTDASAWMFWVHLFRLIPSGIRDGVYAYFAKNRYRWFGKRERCMIPSQSDLKRFIP
jgi:predicted DCC family thiol-disulfide oxidoreductase YuxK